MYLETVSETPGIRNSKHEPGHTKVKGTETLKLKDVQTHFLTEGSVVKAVDNVSLSIDKGESLGLVGESGCGKSMTAFSILRLVPDPPGKIVGGEVHFQGEDLLRYTEKEMRAIRGKEIAMIFQEPSTSMNPSFTMVTEKAMDILKAVQISDPRRILSQYPHELSGGMLQRVMIAMAISCEPSLLICDEPTTALDVSTQAQIIKLLNELREEMGTSLLFITHDLGVLSWVCTYAAVMYAGNIVEYSDIRTILKNPGHPYTRALIGSTPRLDIDVENLNVIPGQVPNLAKLPSGCKFHPRCQIAEDKCREEVPPLIEKEVAEDGSKSSFTGDHGLKEVFLH
ncbi:MAG: ABC transporter ATP-binding protein [Deltaproteobacteria bacterium]|nr:ABC transporter ATP-binding protein [Deltaproteobacteria bacterium]